MSLISHLLSQVASLADLAATDRCSTTLSSLFRSRSLSLFHLISHPHSFLSELFAPFHLTRLDTAATLPLFPRPPLLSLYLPPSCLLVPTSALRILYRPAVSGGRVDRGLSAGLRSQGRRNRERRSCVVTRVTECGLFVMTGTFRRGHFIVEIYERTLYIHHAITPGMRGLLLLASSNRQNATIAALCA